MAGAVSARQERKSQRGNRFAFVSLSDPTGLYEVTCFSEVLEASRHHMETGSNVIVQVKAELEADQVKLLAAQVQPVDDAIAAEARGLRIFLDKPDAVKTVSGFLAQAKSDGVRSALGPIHLCLMAGDLPGEVEVELGPDFPVSPQIKGALRSLPDVITVEEL
jgi:DNA polymerase-3 subunit alpha